MWLRVGRRERLTTELETQQLLWESQHISHYRITADYLSNLSYAPICASATIEVEGDAVRIIQGEGMDTQWCPGIYQQLTVEGLYALALSYIQHDDPVHMAILEIEYDKNYGFVRVLRTRWQTTLFDSPLKEETSDLARPTFLEIKVTDFQVLKP